MTTSIERVPTRTCVGCRKRDEQHKLLRVVGVATRSGRSGTVLLQPDPNRREPGRGVYVHPTAGCMQIAEERKAFGRALRVGSNADATSVTRWIEMQRNDQMNARPLG